MGKKLGNEIKWYRPFALVRRNKELELLTETQFLTLTDYSDEVKELKSKIENMDKLIRNKDNKLKSLIKDLKIFNKENIELKNKIIDLENNIEILFNELPKTKQKKIRNEDK